MTQTLRRAQASILAVVTVLAIGTASIAGEQPSGGDLTLRRATIASGGGESSGGEFGLKGTIGQMETSTVTGGAFTLRAGFWTANGELSTVIFSNGFEGDF